MYLLCMSQCMAKIIEALFMVFLIILVHYFFVFFVNLLITLH